MLGRGAGGCEGGPSSRVNSDGRQNVCYGMPCTCYGIRYACYVRYALTNICAHGIRSRIR